MMEKFEDKLTKITEKSLIEKYTKENSKEK